MANEEVKTEEEKPAEEAPAEEKPALENLVPDVDPELLKVINVAMLQVEERLANRLDATIAGINQALETTGQAINNIQTQTAQVMQTAPGMIQEVVQKQLNENIKGIIQQINVQFDEKAKEYMDKLGGGGDNGAGGGFNINSLLAHSDKLIGVINAFRQPTTEQAMMGQMSFVMKWHQILSKLEKGGGNPDDLTSSIVKTFTPPGEEAPGST